MGKKNKEHCCHDAEACYPPAMAMASPYLIDSPQMRWAFVRKVYAIVAMQLLLTVVVAATVNLVDPIRAFFQSRTKEAVIAFVLIIISPIIGNILCWLLIALHCSFFLETGPLNLPSLEAFTGECEAGMEPPPVGCNHAPLAAGTVAGPHCIAVAAQLADQCVYYWSSNDPDDLLPEEAPDQPRAPGALHRLHQPRRGPWLPIEKR
jgi:hypothetical protein